MSKLKKLYIVLLTIVMVSFLTLPLTSCDPHRSGSVIKGPKSKNKRHSQPASAKRVRKSKY
jgi:hypothetical protein